MAHSTKALPQRENRTLVPPTITLALWHLRQVWGLLLAVWASMCSQCDVRRETARTSHRSLWQRWNLDMVAAIVSLTAQENVEIPLRLAHSVSGKHAKHWNRSGSANELTIAC